VFRQNNLRSLEIEEVSTNSFEWSELNNLNKLKMKDLLFARKDAFESFTEFIKSLEKVKELDLHVMEDQYRNHNNYTEILTHILNLPGLTKLIIHSREFEKEIFKSLTQNDSKIEHLELMDNCIQRMFLRLGNRPSIETKYVGHLINKLPMLRILKFHKNLQNPLEVAHLIGSNFDKLEHFEMTTDINEDPTEVFEYFKQKIPHYKTEVQWRCQFKIVVVRTLYPGEYNF
jgi:hypothetical protein